MVWSSSSTLTSIFSKSLIKEIHPLIWALMDVYLDILKLKRCCFKTRQFATNLVKYNSSNFTHKSTNVFSKRTLLENIVTNILLNSCEGFTIHLIPFIFDRHCRFLWFSEQSLLRTILCQHNKNSNLSSTEVDIPIEFLNVFIIDMVEPRALIPIDIINSIDMILHDWWEKNHIYS